MYRYVSIASTRILKGLKLRRVETGLGGRKKIEIDISINFSFRDPILVRSLF